MSSTVRYAMAFQEYRAEMVLAAGPNPLDNLNSPDAVIFLRRISNVCGQCLNSGTPWVASHVAQVSRPDFQANQLHALQF